MATRWTFLPVMALLLAFAAESGSAWGQLPTTATPPPTTLWSFLGIPQGLRSMKDKWANRFGNHPGLERKPPLKALADPANLKSDVPEIKAAAEIKEAEDLKPQKIKAIKYLAEIGCGCYDKDGKVSKALLAAMDDCTEDVRLATVEAIGEAAQSERCAHCKERSCCNPKITEQLSKMAFERNDQGCWLEPSERVRDAARQALCACCPSYGPPAVEPTPSPIEGGQEPGKIERSEPGAGEKPAPNDAKEAKPTPADGAPQPPTTAQDDDGGDAGEPAVMTSSRRTASRLAHASVGATLRHPEVRAASQTTLADASDGAVVYLDADGKTVRVKLPEKVRSVPVGTKVGVYELRDGRHVLLGQLQVIQATPGSAVMQPVGGFDLSQLSAGTMLAGF